MDLSPVGVAEPDARVRHVPEAILQSLWAEQRFDRTALKTADGAAVHVLHPGVLNRDSGPDFRGARIRLEGPDGSILWSGDVEVHRTSGEWLLHRHDADARYNGVVLHVVLLADRHTGSLRRADGTDLPELVLDGRLADPLRRLLYDFFAHPRPDYPCAALWDDVPEPFKQAWLRRLGLERLRDRVYTLSERFAHEPDLAALLHVAVFRALGYAKNAEPMVELARRLPLPTVRYLDDRQDVEAALFGVAGLLPDAAAMQRSDPASAAHVAALRGRFESLRTAFDLQPMEPLRWQFFRLRPMNFPTRRIAQAAALMAPPMARSASGFLRDDPLGRLREALADPHPITALRVLFQSAEPDPFWHDHVRFERTTTPSAAALGREHADRVLMDAVLPILLLDAEQRGDVAQEEAVSSVMQRLPGADDVVTRRYTRDGTRPASALYTQGLHQLHRAWCIPGRCLDCAIGQFLLHRPDS